MRFKRAMREGVWRILALILGLTAGQAMATPPRCQLEQEATRLQTAIQNHIDQYPRLRQDRDLLQSIPAVGEKTAQRLLVVLHSRDFGFIPTKVRNPPQEFLLAIE